MGAAGKPLPFGIMSEVRHYYYYNYYQLPYIMH